MNDEAAAFYPDIIGLFLSLKTFASACRHCYLERIREKLIFLIEYVYRPNDVGTPFP